MPAPLQPQEIRNLGVRGVIRQAKVDDFLIPAGAVSEAINVHFDRLGATTVRLGLDAVGATIATGYPIWGLFNAQGGTLLAVISQGASARVYAFDGTTWNSSLTGGTANVRTRFVDFAGRTCAINFIYTTLSSIRVWRRITNGDAEWANTGDPINPQNLWGYTPKYAEVYKSRMYVIGDDTNPDRLFFSSVINSDGNITWSPTLDYVDINPNDGENATGLKRYSLELLVFKPNYIYRFRTSGLDPDPLIKIGTRSQESVIEGKKGVYFHHDTGFYRYSGGYPIEISKPIADVVAAIPYAQYGIISSWKDDDNIYWGNLGNLTIEGATWSNPVVRYTESSEIWTIYSYPQGIRFGSVFNNLSTTRAVVGTDGGVVGAINNSYTDFLEPIKYRMITKWYEWEGIAYRKSISYLVGICEKAQGSQLFYQSDDDYTWKEIGQLLKFITHFDKVKMQFHRIRFKFQGVSRAEPPIFLGLQVIEGINEGIIKE